METYIHDRFMNLLFIEKILVPQLLDSLRTLFSLMISCLKFNFRFTLCFTRNLFILL